MASFRLRDEYSVDCVFEGVNVVTARWVHCDDPRKLEEFTKKAKGELAIDHTGRLVYLATSAVKLSLTKERWPDIEFQMTREHNAVELS